MNDQRTNLQSLDYDSDQATPSDETPEFGLLDVIEAFTAMRHESRGQQKESRELSAALESAVGNIQSLESRLLAATEVRPNSERELVELVIEMDIQLTRIADTLSQQVVDRRQRKEAERQRLRDTYEGLGWLSRWFAKRLWAVVDEVQQSQSEHDDDQPLLDATTIVLNKLHRMMEDCQLDREEVIGKPFAPESMSAIDTVASDKVTAGHVAEQLAPSYSWRGKLIRYAQVRIAK